MSMNHRQFIPRAFAVLGLLSGISLGTPPSHAGEALTLQPADDRDVPEGSQIPESRVYETEMKVREYQERMRERSAAQRQERLQQQETSKPKADPPR